MAELERSGDVMADAPALLRLGRRDRGAARAQLKGLSAEQQAQLCRELRAEVRAEFLMLLDHPEHVVPLLPEAELAISIRAGGMSEAAWLLELSTKAQLLACFDLDCWKRYDLDVARMREWIDALIEGGRPTLLRALDEMDLELWILSLRDMTEVAVVGKEEEPPDGWFTIDGVVYFGANEEDFPRVREIAGASFDGAQRTYWQLVYGLLFETPAECEEFALRWRDARLNDLGFPARAQAMEAYRPLQAKEAGVWEVPSESSALVPSLELPSKLDGTLLGEALAKLPTQRAADVLSYVLGVANSLAVADELSLVDPESVPRALEKAVRGIDIGLRELAQVRGQAIQDVLDRARPLDLFRIGATLDPKLRER